MNWDDEVWEQIAEDRTPRCDWCGDEIGSGSRCDAHLVYDELGGEG